MSIINGVHITLEDLDEICDIDVEMMTTLLDCVMDAPKINLSLPTYNRKYANILFDFINKHAKKYQKLLTDPKFKALKSAVH
jgi:hypothetical protein